MHICCNWQLIDRLEVILSIAHCIVCSKYSFLRVFPKRLEEYCPDSLEPGRCNNLFIRQPGCVMVDIRVAMCHAVISLDRMCVAQRQLADEYVRR